MKKSILAAAVGAAAFSFATFAPVQAGVVGPMSSATKAEISSNMIEKVRRRGRGFAIGAGIVTLGILGALAASRRAHSEPYYVRRHRPHYNSHAHQCRRLLRWCRHGDDQACWRFDNRC